MILPPSILTMELFPVTPTAGSVLVISILPLFNVKEPPLTIISAAKLEVVPLIVPLFSESVLFFTVRLPLLIIIALDPTSRVCPFKSSVTSPEITSIPSSVMSPSS